MHQPVLVASNRHRPIRDMDNAQRETNQYGRYVINAQKKIRVIGRACAGNSRGMSFWVCLGLNVALNASADSQVVKTFSSSFSSAPQWKARRKHSTNPTADNR